jgi:hypothetical protein
MNFSFVGNYDNVWISVSSTSVKRHSRTSKEVNVTLDESQFRSHSIEYTLLYVECVAYKNKIKS